MATTTLIRANATRSSSGWNPSAGTLHGVLSDSSDGTWAESVGAYSVAFLETGTFTIPALEYVQSVRAVCRVLTLSTGPTSVWRTNFFIPSANKTYPTQDYFTSNLPTITWFHGPWHHSSPKGATWTQADINELVLFMDTGFGSPAIRMMDYYIEVLTNELPVTNVSEPTGTVAYATRPPVKFDYSDAEGDQMGGYRIKIFSNSQYGAGGFNPETSAAVWDSGIVTSTTINPDGVPPTVDLANGSTYKAYVKVKQFLDQKFGAWDDGPAFTQNVVLPPTPSITIFKEDVRNRIAIRFATNPNDAGMYAEYQRSHTNGILWEDGRETGLIAGLGAPFTIYDIENTPNNPVKYRARFVTVTSGFTVAGAWSAASSVVAPLVDEWWLKDPLIPDLGMEINVAEFKRNIPEDQAVYSPLGSPRKVVVSDVIRGAEGSIIFEFLSENQYDNFVFLRAIQHTLLLQRPWSNQQWYIRLGQNAEITEHNSDTAYKLVSCTFTEVEVP